MAKPIEVTVSGTAFLIQPLDAFEALAIFGDLQKDILPAAGGLVSLLAGGQDDVRDEAAMAGAIAKLSQRLDGKQLIGWTNRLLTKDLISVELNGNLVPLDAAAKAMAFAEFTDVLELLFHALRVWFGRPLAAWVSRTGLAQKFQAGGLLGGTPTE
ncbi:MAG: hypothetical protein WBA82_07980 [Castellaniella sp.]|uniref:phage tail assembly chaperone n=1 Tax=Castellaniella sp. TaxID=1955812 RepID=UPI003C78A87D